MTETNTVSLEQLMSQLNSTYKSYIRKSGKDRNLSLERYEDLKRQVGSVQKKLRNMSIREKFQWQMTPPTPTPNSWLLTWEPKSLNLPQYKKYDAKSTRTKGFFNIIFSIQTPLGQTDYEKPLILAPVSIIAYCVPKLPKFIEEMIKDIERKEKELDNKNYEVKME